MAASEPSVTGTITRGQTLAGEEAPSSRIQIWTGLGAAAILLVVVLLGPILAPHDPTVPVGNPFTAPSLKFLLGTDEIGRDIFSRVLYGLRETWWATLAVIGTGVIIGTLVGLVAGMSGGIVDAFLMRFTDAFLALPGPILAIAVVAALGPSLWNLLLAMMIVWWPIYARIVRAEIRSLAVRPHMDAARLAGVSSARLAFRHLMPGALPPLVVAASLDVGLTVLALASLSFLGLGSPAPAPELGAMSARGLPYLLDYWWVPVMPALVVFAMAFIANYCGDAIRDLMRHR